jgi:hypothetical protein
MFQVTRLTLSLSRWPYKNLWQLQKKFFYLSWFGLGKMHRKSTNKAVKKKKKKIIVEFQAYLLYSFGRATGNISIF